MSALLDAALAYAARGFRVLPLHNIADGACTCGKPACGKSAGKHPRVRTGRKHAIASSDPETVVGWWTKWPLANVGIATGGDLVVVDLDGAAGVALLADLARRHGGLPRTLQARSGRPDGGRHLYYRVSRPLPNSTGGGLDLRGEGGLVVAPPSMHLSGQPYAWVDAAAEVGDMPEWLASWFETREGSGQGKARGTSQRVFNRSDVVGVELGLGPRPAWLDSGRVDAAPGVLSEPLPPLGDVSAALALLPNEDRGWEAYNRVAMLVWTCTGGSPEGREVFRAWSAKCGKHRDLEVDERWAHYPASPPTALGFGTLVHLARDVEPGWEPPSRRKVAVDPHGAREGAGGKRSGAGGPSAGSGPGATGGVKQANGHGLALPPELTGEGGDPLIKLNERYAVIGDVGGKCLVLGWVPSKVDAVLKVPSFQTFKSFSERYASQYVMVPREAKGEVLEEAKQVGTYWLKWTGRRSFEGIELEPNQPAVLPGNVMNLWSGFAVEPVEGSWALMRRHIVDVLADGDAAAARYIARFAAWAVQNPGERAEVALVFRGGKGSGKGTFANALRALFGQHGLQIYSRSHLVGSFNGHLRNCLLLFADEAFWAGDKVGESALKGLLSEKVLMIEQKGVDAVQWRNRLHVIMAANAEWVVPASHDERRYATFDVSDKRVGDREYFKALNAEIAGGGLAAMLYDLLRMDLTGWHPREILQTAALQHQKARSLDARHAWLEHILQTGELPTRLAGEFHYTVGAADVFNAVMQFQHRSGEINPTNVGRFLREFGFIRVHRKFGSTWQFPPAAALRATWESKFGAWDWQEKMEKWPE